jgi:hypothetical protein
MRANKNTLRYQKSNYEPPLEVSNNLLYKRFYFDLHYQDTLDINIGRDID